MGEVSNLLTYECFASYNKCRFDRNPKNIPISEGDINIKSDVDFGDGEDCLLFFFTFLFELIPL